MSLLRGRWLLIALAALLAAWAPFQIADPEVEVAERPLLIAPQPVRLRGSVDPAPLIARLDLSGGAAPGATAPLPADMAAAPPAQLPLPALVGTALRPNGRGVALVRGSNGQVVTLTPGSEIDGWCLARIGRGEVRFARDGVTERVSLDLKNREPAQASAPPATPAFASQDND
jgi:hypothetical protein